MPNIKLTGRDLDAAVAVEIMGWRKLTDADNLPLRGDWWLVPGTTADWDSEFPDYSTDANAVALVRAEIERRGLFFELYVALSKIIGLDWSSHLSVCFGTIINATPEQQCRAALEAVRGENHE